MAEEKEKRKFIKKIKDKYRFVIYNDTTFEEVLHFRLSRLNVFAYVGISVVLIATLVVILIVFTPLREFIPQYPDSVLQREIVENALRVDSLEQELRVRDQYFNNIKTIIEGKEPDNFVSAQDTTTEYKEISFDKSIQDSILRQQVEAEEQYNLANIEDPFMMQSISSLDFFAPINKGVITNPFNLKEGHFGVDLVAAPNTGVMTVLDGTVTMATWTLPTGYVIQVQHKDNFVSFYKHNSALLKEVGDKVKAGETIAIIGNSGELSTGPHLHFELWQNGAPLDPEDYIVF